MVITHRWMEAPVLRRLPPEDLAWMQRHAVPRLFEAEEMIAGEGEEWPWLLTVEYGQVLVSRISAEGRLMTPLTLRPGDFFWGRPLFEREAMPASLTAGPATRVLLWPLPEIVPLLRRTPDAMWDLCGLMSRLMVQAADYMEGLAFQTLAARTARMLLEQYGSEPGAPRERSLSLEQMAAHLSSRSEVVCRVLQGFAARGLISLTRTAIAIQDVEGLRRAAAGTQTVAPSDGSPGSGL